MSSGRKNPLADADPGQTLAASPPRAMAGDEGQGSAAPPVDNSLTIPEPMVMQGDGAETEAVVLRHLAQIDAWADANRRDTWLDQLRFWAFKIPAMVGATSTSALEAAGLGKAVIFIGIISAVCIGVDAIFPGGRLYNVHMRAFNDLRLLGTALATEWDRIKLELPDPGSRARVDAAIRLLERIQHERERIGHYITDGEASFGRGGEGGGAGRGGR